MVKGELFIFEHFLTPDSYVMGCPLCVFHTLRHLTREDGEKEFSKHVAQIHPDK